MLPRFGTSTEELQLSTPCYSFKFVIIYIMRSSLRRSKSTQQARRELAGAAAHLVRVTPKAAGR